jgi:hypothetical protein
MLGLIAVALQAGSMVMGGIGSARAAGANRRFARQAANVELERGEEEAGIYRMRLNQLLGQQRTAIAGQNIDVTQGSAAQIRADTEAIGSQDIERIRLNAQRSAWGIRTQANLNYRAGMNQAASQFMGAAGTLMGNAPDAWTRFVGGRQNRVANKVATQIAGSPEWY